MTPGEGQVASPGGEEAWGTKQGGKSLDGLGSVPPKIGGALKWQKGRHEESGRVWEGINIVFRRVGGRFCGKPIRLKMVQAGGLVCGWGGLLGGKMGE